MKSQLIFFFLLTLFSCEKTEKIKMQKKRISGSAKTEKAIIKIDSLPANNNSLSEKPTESSSDYAEFKNEFDILIPRSYRDWEYKNEADKLNKNWLALLKIDKKYFLEKADYKISRGFDECVGDSTKIIEAENTILFLDNPNFKTGLLNSVAITKKKIWPAQKWNFTFNNVKYQLQAKGQITSKEKFSNTDGDDAFYEVANYKLYISAANAQETLLLQQDTFNDTFVELLFIGDFDRDGKPDFVFSANRNYEEERVVVYLSSRAKKGKAAEKVSEIAVQFDC